MGNLITNERAGDAALRMSNGATSVLVSVLLLAGSELASTTWEQALVVWLAEHDQAHLGLGVVGFDLSAIAWSRSDFGAQKAFVLRVIDLAATRHGWSTLGYDPPFVGADLDHLRKLVESFTVDLVGDDHGWDWRSDLEPCAVERCPTHGVFLHHLSVDPAQCCHLCNDAPSPTQPGP